MIPRPAYTDDPVPLWGSFLDGDRLCRIRWMRTLDIGLCGAFDRDDQELVAHAETASARMKELCADARAEIAPLGRAAGRLDAIAAWITSRAT